MTTMEAMEKIGIFSDEWEDLPAEEKLSRLCGVIDEVSDSVKDEDVPDDRSDVQREAELTALDDVPEEDKAPVLRLSIASMLISRFLADHVPIPPEAVAYYNDSLQKILGFEDYTFAVSSKAWNKNIPLIEKTFMPRYGIKSGEEKAD